MRYICAYKKCKKVFQYSRRYPKKKYHSDRCRQLDWDQKHPRKGVRR